jgi:transglutaminase-like putative cysteine protease
MRLTIHHETVYDYPYPVTNSINEAWLRPLTDERQSCLSFRLTTRPGSDPRPYEDYFGNTVYHFDIYEQHRKLQILAEAEVLTEPFDAGAALLTDPAPFEPLAQADDQWLDFLSSTPLTTPGERIQELGRLLAGEGTTVASMARALADAVRGSMRYQFGYTTVGTTAEQALSGGAGVCQDYTHIFLSVSHLLGIPARYVSGYLFDGDAAGDVQKTHAWPEVLLPATGWVGLDVTNGNAVDERYVRVAIGRDYADVPPVRGAYSGAAGSGPAVSVFVREEEQQQQQ